MLSSASARTLSITFCWVRLLVLLSQIPNGWFQVLQALFKDSLKPSQARGVGCNPLPTDLQSDWFFPRSGELVCSCRVQLPPLGTTPSVPRFKWTLWFFSSSKWSPGAYLTTKTTLAWLKDWRAEANVNMHWQILVDAGWEPLPSPKLPTSLFHLLLGSHPFSRSCVYMSVRDTIKQSKSKCAT